MGFRVEYENLINFDVLNKNLNKRSILDLIVESETWKYLVAFFGENVIYGVLFNTFLIVAIFIWWDSSCRIARNKFEHVETKKNLPGSNLLPFLDSWLHGGERMLKAPYGDFELSFFLGSATVVVSEPVITKEILKGTGIRDFGRSKVILDITSPIAGKDNVFTGESLVWLHQRGILNSAFRPSYMKLLLTTMSETIDSTVGKWVNDNAPEDVATAINALTLGIICNTAFGSNTSDSGLSEDNPTNPQSIAASYKVMYDNLIYMVGGGKGFKSIKQLFDNASYHIDSVAQSGKLIRY